jgi:hypothetical protein
MVSSSGTNSPTGTTSIRILIGHYHSDGNHPCSEMVSSSGTNSPTRTTSARRWYPHRALTPRQEPLPLGNGYHLPMWTTYVWWHPWR